MIADIAIDLGTTHTRVVTRGGEITEVPTVVATGTGPRGTEVLAVGEAAHRMIGRTPAGVQVSRPVRAGVVADFASTEHLLRHLIHEVTGRGLRGPRLMVCSPSGATEVERRAIQESARAAGARQVVLVPTPLVAALGAQLPVAQAVGSLLVDIGGGRTHVAALSLGGLVVDRSVQVAGDQLDEAIIHWLRSQHSLLVGERTAINLKHHVGAARADLPHRQMRVRGRDLVTSTPRELDITLGDVTEALQGPLSIIRTTLHDALRVLPPELAADISQRGLVLCGGTSQLPGLDRLLADEILLPVLLAEEPTRCASRGAHVLMEDQALFERVAETL